MMKRALPWIGIGLLAVVAVLVFARRSHREMPDFEVYRAAGVRATVAEPLYRAADEHWQFKYLPAFALAMVPLAQLPPVAARGVWFFLSVGLVVLLVSRAFVLLPDRRARAGFLVSLTVVAMGKFYGRELGLGQSNTLMAVLVLLALDCRYRGREPAAGTLLAAATIVKPYAVIFLPYLAARRRWAAVAGYGAVALAALFLPALQYGWSGNLDQLHGWWTVVTTSTTPNLSGQDNVSIAGMYAAWMGVGPATGWLSLASGLVLAAACAWAVWKGSSLASPDYLDTALLLFVIPLLSPQGWDYVLLVATPAVMLLLDRNGELHRAARWLLFTSLAVVGLTFYDVLGREAFRAVMMSRAITVAALFQVALLIHLRGRRAA
jgi:hypothetical protein